MSDLKHLTYEQLVEAKVQSECVIAEHRRKEGVFRGKANSEQTRLDWIKKYMREKLKGDIERLEQAGYLVLAPDQYTTVRIDDDADFKKFTIMYQMPRAQ